jgi:hypothetical protein
MASPNQRTGKVSLYIDGVYYESDGSSKISGFAPTREDVIGDRAYGYKERPVMGQIDAVFVHGGGLSLEALGQITNSTLVFASDSGAVYTLSNAWAAEVKELDGKEGTIAATFKSANTPQETLP